MFEKATSYRNNEECTWFIDVDPATAGGHKTEKLNIYLLDMDIHPGETRYHPFPDIVTIYKGHERSTIDCFDTCVRPIGVFLWKDCPESFPIQSPRASCILTQQYGRYVQCDKSNEWTYRKSCWDTPKRWTVDFAKARIDFNSTSNYIGGNFRIGWEAEVSAPSESVVFGLGTVQAKAGFLNNVTLQARWVDSKKMIQNRTTGGSDVRMIFKYNNILPNETILQHALDTNDGYYHMYYIPKYAGVHTLYIRMFGKEVTGSPFTVVVQPGTVDPNKCRAYDSEKMDTADVGGLTGGRAGRDYTFMVECYDEYDNLVTIHEQGSSSPFSVNFQGLDLYWAKVEKSSKTGVYDIKFNIPKKGEYKIHVSYRLTYNTFAAISGSPFEAVISTIPCPLVGQPPCNGQGTCLDSGLCVCKQGWDGEYCQVDLVAFLRVAIVVENAFLGCMLLMFSFRYFYYNFIVSKQIFERLKHDDTEEAW